MKKQKHIKLPSWLWGAVVAGIIIPTVTFSWNNIQNIWAAPKKINTIEDVVKSQQETQEQLKDIVKRHDQQIVKEEEVTALQIQNLKELITTLKDMKKAE